MRATCPRCPRPAHRRRFYCSTACRDADAVEAPQRLADVLVKRARRHEARAPTSSTLTGVQTAQQPYDDKPKSGGKTAVQLTEGTTE